MSTHAAQTKAVFAHFLVGNANALTAVDRVSEISLAQEAHIDAFALNVAHGDTNNAATLATVFPAAKAAGFKLFFSFLRLSGVGSSPAYYQYDKKPLVSTFEGWQQGSDWNSINSATNCFFVPEWSRPPAEAITLGPVDGLFSWDAWPLGAADKTTSNDQAFKAALGSKPYMMPVSPWFFTSLPKYGKNWLWRGDDLWFDRWEQVQAMQPEFVEIISWNDYGESHHIGPLHDNEFGLFTEGGAPFNYAAGLPHDGWRLVLPYVIDRYKNGSASVGREGGIAWYRLNPKTSCGTGGTTDNSALNGQQVVDVTTVVQNQVFFTALLTSAADVSVSIGGSIRKGGWRTTPTNGNGLYHGSVDFGGRTGAVVVTVSRAGKTIAQIDGANIFTSCTNGVENWNAWVGSATV